MCFGGANVVLIITTLPVRATVGLLVIVLAVVEDGVSVYFCSVVEDTSAVVVVAAVVVVVVLVTAVLATAIEGLVVGL